MYPSATGRLVASVATLVLGLVYRKGSRPLVVVARPRLQGIETMRTVASTQSHWPVGRYALTYLAVLMPAMLVGVPYRIAAPLAFASTWIVIDRTRSGPGWTAISTAVFVAADHVFGS